MKKQFLPIAALSLLALASCGPKTSSGPTDSLQTDSSGGVVFDNVKLTVWSVIGDPDQTYLNMVNNTFNDLYQGQIEVELQPVSESVYYTQLANVINTDPDMAPDVVLFHSERLTTLARDNIIVPMDEYFELSQSDFSRDDYLENVMAECLYEGKTYGVPLDVHAGVWFVRTDILEKNGLSKPSSLSEFKNVCNELIRLNEAGELWHRAMDETKPAAGDWVQSRLPNFYPVVMSDTGGIENGWIPQTAVFQNGGELTDSRGYPAWNTDALIKVMSMFRDWQSGQGYEGRFVGPGQSSETVWSNLASGNAVFSCEGPWWIEQRFDEYERNLGDREDSEGKTYKPLDIMNMSKLYALDENADCASDIYGVGHCFSITRTCDSNAKRAAAAVYAEYMTSHSASYMQGGHLPASKEVLSSPQYLESEYYERYLQEFGDPENFRMLGNTPYYTEVYEGLKSVYIDIFSSNMASRTPEQIVESRYNEAVQAIQSSEDL
ncbi:MAG: extracellular solute-binding protein [Firmicutes bacterium]|uniref:Extracellular solute-binding protein n=1 Tax=Candidatus Alloenteromonas pullistercoris TaxID=2840785 RepID=A0A9D9GW48_9FIRM|nr:extracellular solute-binding protein [Candidatus Enteromonas pullistercoris]